MTLLRRDSTIPEALPAPRAELLRDVFGAQSRGELVLRFVPRIALDDGRVDVCESFVTWEHPRHGPIADTVFVPLLRELELMNRFSRFWLFGVAAYATRWPGRPRPRVSMRLGYDDFAGEGFDVTFRHTLRAMGLELSRLELSIPAQALARGTPEVTRVIAGLRADGARILVRDPEPVLAWFLSCAQLPADALLLPRRLVAAVASHAKERGDARVLSGLASSLHLELVAEGVATDAEEDAAIALGARYVSGSLHGPALSGPELERWLERRLESGAPPRRVSWPDAEAHPALRSTRDR
ncbi:MAG: EAL domain-containing protein [Polyangiales bacterium]